MRKTSGPGAPASAAEAGTDDPTRTVDTKPGQIPQRAQQSGDPRNKTFSRAEKAYKACRSGKSFVPHTAELLASAAWRNRSIYAVRFINLLELDHAGHNGQDNGFLKATWRQMREAGIGSDYIADTIAEAVALGLVRVTHKGQYRGGARNDPSTYRLNYLPWKFVPAAGAPLYYAPNDEWKHYKGKSARAKRARMNRTWGPSGNTRGDQGAITKVVRFPRSRTKHHAAE